MADSFDSYLAPILYRMQKRRRFCSADEVIESVRENIECLMNSRLTVPADYVLRPTDPQLLERLNNSLVNFGVVDFQSLNMGDPLMEKRFCESVRQSIVRFEPRLTKVSVEMSSSVSDRLISAQVTAQLAVEPFEEIQLESGLDASNHSFVVT